MIRAAVLTLILSACAPPDSGMAGCWERLPDGRPQYRDDLPPMVSRWCPTWGEAVAMQEVAPDECRGMCRLRSLLAAP